MVFGLERRSLAVAFVMSFRELIGLKPKIIVDCLEWEKSGCVLPFGYAYGHKEFARDAVVLYPIGIHILVQWWRDVVFFLFTRRSKRDVVEQSAYFSGVGKQQKRLEVECDLARDETRRWREMFETADERGFQRGWLECQKQTLDLVDRYFNAKLGGTTTVLRKDD